MAWFYRDKNCAAINSDPEDIWDERLSEQNKIDRNLTLADCQLVIPNTKERELKKQRFPSKTKVANEK